MSAESILGVPPVAPGATPASEVQRPVIAAEPAGVQRTGESFGSMVSNALGEVNGQLLASQADLQQLAVGNVQNLHQILIRLEESRLSFQLLLQVRSRLLEAYQDVMKLQV